MDLRLVAVLAALFLMPACAADDDDDSEGSGGTGGPDAGGGSAEGGSAQGGSAEGGSAEGGSAEGGSAEGGSAEGGSAEGGSGGEDDVSEYLGLGEPEYGHISLYHDQDGPRQDLSGAAHHGQVVFVDDGGKPSDFNFIRVMQSFSTDGDLDQDAVDLPLTLPHIDLEGATWSDGYFVITTSFGDADNPDNRRLTRFGLTDDPAITDEESVDLRDDLMATLHEQFGDEWYDRMSEEAAKSGGLNIEGVSTAGDQDNTLAWGLRSPLSGDDFGNPDTDPGLSLSNGEAIVVWVTDAFNAAGFSLTTVNLEGHGIRSIEWSDYMQGYVIIGGPVPKANDYTLWLWRPGTDDLEPLELDGFHDLCRPESILEIVEEDVPYLYILSEESGAACDGVSFTTIRAEILISE